MCCMCSIDRFSEMLICEVALHLINTWDINDLTFESAIVLVFKAGAFHYFWALTYSLVATQPTTSWILLNIFIPIKIIVTSVLNVNPWKSSPHWSNINMQRFSKASHRCVAKVSGLFLLANFKFWVFALWHITLVLYSQRKSS